MKLKSDLYSPNSLGNVYVNRTLNMKQIHYIGLDMDHTLIRYNSENFERLAHKIMKESLVRDFNYPESILQIPFEFDKAIRGLVIDKSGGNLLKLSRYGAIRSSSHGHRKVDYKTQKRLYRGTYIDLSDPNYDTVDTTFSIAIATLFGQLVDLKDSSESQTLPDYKTIADDLNFVLDQAHRKGALKNQVRDHLKDFIIQDPELVQGLERYKKHGKKIFVLTNSEFFYTKLLMDYAITPFLEHHKSWTDLFEFVITLAQKPRFFYDKLPFLKVNPDNGTLTNLDGPLTPGGIYQGGCASKFTEDLGISSQEILYIGDHIYGDIVRLKKDCAWRTALVVEEIEKEVKSLKKVEPISKQIETLMASKIPFELESSELFSDQIEKDHKKHELRIEELRHQIEEIDQKISPLIREREQAFNPYWGEVMRAGIEESFLAYQVERFACIYMAKLSDLLEHSPRTYYRFFKRPMPHE